MTTTPSTTTGSISSAGIGSGLDVKSIISSLMAVESQPLQLLQDKASTVNTEISAVGQIQSLASALGDKAHALSSTSLWTQTTSSTADPSVVTADTSSGTAAAGDYSVSVQQLAQGQTVTSAHVRVGGVHAQRGHPHDPARLVHVRRPPRRRRPRSPTSPTPVR